jgi:hypothetical protein
VRGVTQGLPPVFSTLMTQENRTQEPPTAAPEPGELPAAELALVVGGGDGGPTNAGDNNGRS